MATMSSNRNTAAQNGIVSTLDRIGDVAVAKPAAFVARRVEEQTDALSVVQRLTATAHLLNAVLSRFTALAYEPLRDGTPAAIDTVTGIVGIPAPWATNSYARWGLKRGEQATMRRYLRQWQFDRTAAPALYFYNRQVNRWCANLEDYPDLRAALRVLERGLFTAEIVAQMERTERAADARRRHRGRT